MAIKKDKDKNKEKLNNFFWRARVKRHMNNYKDAIDDYLKVIADPNNVDPQIFFESQFSIGVCYRRVGNLE